ncbi:MAG TPA: ribose 5-phosphate isomerase B [Rubricoccaceae bacterium]|jgi:ribose 5-phosphate isomerase B
MPSRPLVSEQTVLAAAAAGLASVSVPAGALVTAQARDTARSRGIRLDPAAATTTAAPAGPAAPPAAPAKTLALACDHAGFAYKSAVADHARALGWSVVDLGTDSEAAVDYPDFAFAVARAVHAGQVRFGVMIDGVGVGSAMVANKLPGVRAALCPDVFSAFNARAHNDANVLTLGSRTMGVETCRRVLAEFLAVAFEGGRHAARVQKILDVEARFLPGATAGATTSAARA